MGLQAQQDVGHSPYNLRTLILGHYRLHLPFSVEGPSSLCINQKETADFRAQTVGRDRAESLYVGGLFSEQEARHQQQSHLQRPVPSSVQLKDGRCLGCLPPHPISAQAKGVHTHARAHTRHQTHPSHNTGSMVAYAGVLPVTSVQGWALSPTPWEGAEGGADAHFSGPDI